jgi:hypothetical protein
LPPVLLSACKVAVNVTVSGSVNVTVTVTVNVSISLSNVNVIVTANVTANVNVMVTVTVNAHVPVFLLSRFRPSRFAASVSVFGKQLHVAADHLSLASNSTRFIIELVSYRLGVRLPRLATLCNAPKSNRLLRQNVQRNGLPKAK